MLVLSRGQGQKIFVGEGITITVVEINRGRVRLGIEAPRDMVIRREELPTLNNLKRDASAKRDQAEARRQFSADLEERTPECGT